jgi:flavodoxin
MLNSIVIYWSGTGNTKKVANAICNGLKKAGLKPTLKTVAEADNDDILGYDLVFLGSPSHMFLPAEPVLKFIRGNMRSYRQRDLVKPCAPKVEGKNAVVFCTYSGPHTGKAEAVPAAKCMRQFFEHLGFTVVGEWYVVGEFHGDEVLSTKGKLGNIKGRPNRRDLARVERSVVELVEKLLGRRKKGR